MSDAALAEIRSEVRELRREADSTRAGQRLTGLEATVSEMRDGLMEHKHELKAMTGAFGDLASQIKADREEAKRKAEAEAKAAKDKAEAEAEAAKDKAETPAASSDRWGKIADRVFSFPGAIIVGALLTALSSLLRGEPVDEKALIDAAMQAHRAVAAAEASAPTAPDSDAAANP